MAHPDLAADSGLISQTSSAASFQKIREESTNLEGAFGQQQAENAKLQHSCEEKSKHIQKLEGVISQQEADNATLQHSNEEKSKRLQKLEGVSSQQEADHVKLEKLLGDFSKLEADKAELQHKYEETCRQMQKLQGEVADLHLKYATIVKVLDLGAEPSEYVEPFRKPREVARQRYLLPTEEESEQQQLSVAAGRKPRAKTARKERQVPETVAPPKKPISTSSGSKTATGKRERHSSGTETSEQKSVTLRRTAIPPNKSTSMSRKK